MPNRLINRMLFGALLLASAAVHAQYAWLDEKGIRHYSDQPPPTNTPDSRILKAPHVSMPTPATAKPAPTLEEREADYRKRHAAADEADKKAGADQKLAEAKRANCAAAAANKAQVETGRRLRWDVAGAPNNVMTEEDKAKEIARADAALKDCR